MSIPGVDCPEGKCNYESLSKYFESTYPVDVISGKNLTDPWQMCFVKLNTNAPPVDPVVPEDSDSKWWIALVVLIPVIIIVGLGIWYYSKKRDE
jgi:RsiW-degrading membrane proteinase PrsW (M82 family)